MMAPEPVKANPIMWTYAPGGGVFALNSTVMMPEAYVEAILSPTRINKTAFLYYTTLYGNYSIESPEGINTTIAFAYPAAWNGYYQGVEIIQNSMLILLDGELLESTTVNLWDMDPLPSSFGEIDDEYDWLHEWYKIEFALVNISLQANDSAILEVYSQSNSIVSTDLYDYSYVVGTGRTWSGTTHEIVKFTIRDYSQFIYCDFHPNNSLSIDNSTDYLVAEWDLNLENIEENYVRVYCRQYDWNTDNPIHTPTDPILDDRTILGAFVLIAITVTLVVVYKFNRQRA